MARSMTGFGKAEFKNERFEINAEVRNLNNRYLDIGLRLPKKLAPYEFKVKDLVKSHVIRGKLALSISYKDITGSENPIFNQDSVKTYHNLLQQLKNQTGIAGDITMDHLLAFKDLWEPEESTADDAEIETALLEVVERALENLNKMRDQESANIKPDITGRVDEIEKTLKKIELTTRENPRQEMEKMYQRIKDLVNNGELVRERLELELAVIADRVDVTEECTRLHSHINMFREVFNKKKEVGKSLTFILQEMQRESNTIGSKTSEISVAHNIIHIKEEIEKLREQVQNLE